MASTRGALVGSASTPPDDSDLEDLISKPPRGSSRSNVEIESGGGGGGFLSVTPLGFIAGSCRLFCYQCPCLSKCVLTLILMSSIALFTNYVFNPTKEMGIMGADYSAITSAYDLSLSKVHHWCIQVRKNACRAPLSFLEPPSTWTDDMKCLNGEKKTFDRVFKRGFETLFAAIENDNLETATRWKRAIEKLETEDLLVL